ncbi:Syntaxin-binding protein 5-like protein [Morus notabilis]|uniref:Syntaxin-binding protein 5-like protein n=1 Tax=Morus notabilis TaxID=981085 RepID=W9RFK2_9ROSA|nr:Syntaxin-binding protein 5-like protein [Morus notabilis]
MFAKIFQKSKQQQENSPPQFVGQNNVPERSLTPADFNPRIALHYGIPSTASILAFDAIQQLIAVGTLDGRIKIIGGDNIEGLLVSPKQLPFKYLEFLQNHGFLACVSRDNEIQVWDLENRVIASTLQWGCNITAFSVVYGTSYIILIAYENGLIVLWDASEDQVVLVRGLQLKYETVVDCVRGAKRDLPDNLSDSEQSEKEISALCWASEIGSVLAVGYVDGDIIFWDMSKDASSRYGQGEESANDVVKLQLASGNRRLPVIVLHWSATKSCNHQGGQLFVYGGDQIGSEEVLTILSLEWDKGIESLKCVSRFGLSLYGSFADVVVFPSAYETNSRGTLLFILTNPGQLHVYDKSCLSSLMPQQKNTPVPAVQYTTMVPITEPNMTVSKLGFVHRDGDLSRVLSQIVSAEKLNAAHLPKEDTRWPLTGGVPNQFFDPQTYQVERLYISGYGDGSFRIYDATYPDMSLIYTIGPEVQGIPGAISSVSALEFCSFTLRLAIGDESGRVAMLDIGALSILFLTDAASETSSPITSLGVRSFLDAHGIESRQDSQSEILEDSERGVLFIMTRNAHIIVRDITNGKLISSQPLHPKKDFIAISMYIIEDIDLISEVHSEEHLQEPPQSSEAKNVPSQTDAHSRSTELEVGVVPSYDFPQRLMNFLILLCCEDALYLYSLDSMIEGGSDPIHRVDLAKPCCWTTTFKKDEKECGLIVLYQTGVIEIRSLPTLEVLGESSLTSILRWNFKSDMEKTICSSDNGQIALVNGCELAVISLLNYENDFRIPESLPCLHDTVLAAAVDAAYSSSPNEEQVAASSPGISGGITQGSNVGKALRNVDLNVVHKHNYSRLESLFSTPPFLKPSAASKDDQEILELNLDDIIIDEPLYVSPSSQKHKIEMKDKGTERERLFDGATSDSKLRLRTADEIRAKYRKAGDASGAAAEARDKLVQRQEKLERLGQRTEELRSGAENFASLAKELAKSMENRKWWQI